MFERLKQVAPRWLKTAVKKVMSMFVTPPLRLRSVLTAIHEPRKGEKIALGTRQSFSTLKQPGVKGELPVPPKHLRMGYAESEEEFLESGQATARNIRAMLAANDVQLGVGRTLDWGCASGRVMRWFHEEGRSAPFWGTDRDADCMAWAKENLSPPFEFVTCSSLPHLPFEDRYFRLLWGISVFTHIDLMFDTWMMEVRRILEPGGHALFTLHDEHTVDHFRQSGPPTGIKGANLALIRDSEFSALKGEQWWQTYTFFGSDWISREFGRYFDMIDYTPMAEGYQSMILLRKHPA